MKNKILILVCVIIFIIGAVGSAVALFSPKKSTVSIISDGKTVKTLNLSKEANQTFDIEYDGRINTVEIKGGKIRVKEAECPDKTCVHMGWLESSAMPIVCLPNHLVIEFSNVDDFDAVTR